MFKTPFIGLILAMAGTPAFAQAPESVPAAPTEIAPVSGAVPSEDGRNIINKEFLHRSLVGDKARALEIKQFDLKLAETDASIAEAMLSKTDKESPGPKAATTRPEPLVTPPTIQPLLGAAAIPPPGGAFPLPLPMALTPPKPVGLVGDTVVFQMDRETTTAKLGQSVGGYRVSDIQGRKVTLATVTAPVATLVLDIP